MDETDDVRFLLLSRDGHLPLTAISMEARAAWRALSYGGLAGLLDELTNGTDGGGSARTAVRQ